MAASNFLSEIKSRLNEYTKVEKKIAEYILNNAESIPYMVINELAEVCGVGETSIFRFCKKMKLSGYQEFRMKVSSSFYGDNVLRPSTSGNINIDDDVKTVIEKISSSNIMAIEEAVSLINEDDINNAVELLINAKRIFVYGVGASGIMAQDIFTKFVRITPKIYAVQDSHMQVMQASILDDDDVAIIFSYSGNTEDIIDIAKAVKKCKSKIIGISKYRNSELSKYTDILLLCGAKENPLQGGSLSAKISQIFLVDVLYTEYYKRTIERSKKLNKRTAEAVMKKLY